MSCDLCVRMRGIHKFATIFGAGNFDMTGMWQCVRGEGDEARKNVHRLQTIRRDPEGIPSPPPSEHPVLPVSVNAPRIMIYLAAQTLFQTHVRFQDAYELQHIFNYSSRGFTCVYKKSVHHFD